MLVVVQSYLLLLMKQNILPSAVGGHFNALFTLVIIAVRPDVVSSKLTFHTEAFYKGKLLASDRLHNLLTSGST